MKKNLIYVFLLFPLMGFAQFKSSLDAVVGLEYSYRTWHIAEYKKDIISSTDHRNSEEYQFNYRFGVNYNHQIQSNLFFKTGLRYAKVGYKSERQGLRFNDDFGNFDLVPSTHQTSLTFNYLEIPLVLRYEFSPKKLTAFFEVGFSPYFYLRTKAETDFNEVIFERQDVVNRVNLVGSLSFGFNYQLSERFQLFTQPIARYHFTNLTDGVEDENLYNIGLEIGMRTRLK